MKFLMIQLLVVFSFQWALADSIAGNAVKENLQIIKAQFNKCVNTSSGTSSDETNCVNVARNKYAEELANISAAFLGAYPEYILMIADSEKKWADFVKSNCQFKNAYLEGSMKSLLMANCETEMVYDRVLEMVEIYESYLSSAE